MSGSGSRIAVVTGAGGFIGSAVVRALVASGRRVRAIVERGSDVEHVSGSRVEPIVADIVDNRRIGQVCRGADELVHLAAIYKLWTRDSRRLYAVNVDGTENVLCAARRAGIARIVHTSSVATIGRRPDGTPSDERDPFVPGDTTTEYIRSKAISERIALRHAQAGMHIVVVNPTFPFGPGDRAPTPTGRMILEIAKGHVLGYLPGGMNAIDVDVLGRAHVAALERGRSGERYILGDHNVTSRELARVIARVAERRAFDVAIPTALAHAAGAFFETLAVLGLSNDPRATRRSMRYLTHPTYVDASKARVELGLETRPLADTVRDALAWFRSAGML